MSEVKDTREESKSPEEFLGLRWSEATRLAAALENAARVLRSKEGN
jgi:hypothetical protein